MSLEKYKKKRDFQSTPEPPAVVDRKGKSRFVIQRHQASRLHYDLRLEIDGVLKSWAVPKGPSMNPEDKRLAVRTEDHPVKYLTFEGTIPKGNYGAGDMKIWDTGSFEIMPYKNMETAPEQLSNGNLKLKFQGGRVKGAFALVKTRNKGEQEHWLLIKKEDKYSVTGEYDAEQVTKTAPPSLKQIFIKPMLATLKPEIFNAPDWIYEIKWDGYRLQAHVDHGEVALYSRNGNSYNSKFSAILPELEGIPHQAIFDGEAVLLDEKGMPDFEELQNYPVKGKGNLRYYIFDLLYLNGHSTIELPLLQRKELLQEIIEEEDLEFVRYCDHMSGMGKTFYTMTVESGMEGVIAKQKESVYRPGNRSDQWIKIKSDKSLIAKICGYTKSESTAPFASLVLGQRHDQDLRYIGNCGTGFNADQRKALFRQLKDLETAKSPFPGKPDMKGREVQWVKPELEAEIRFTDWTKNGFLRHPVFKELQENAPKFQEAVKSQSKAEPKPLSQEKSLSFDQAEVPITNLEKVFFPESGYRKYELLDYYLGISEYILPYLSGRPQNLHRHPDGIRKDGFYQKDIENAPAWVRTEKLFSKSSKRDINYLLCEDEATLMYLVNLGCIEINPWNSMVSKLDHPDWSVIDLDPGPANSFEEVIEVAQATKTVLDTAKINGFCKTSGSRGLHIYIPLGGKYTYEESVNFTKLICYYVKEMLPELTSMERQKKARKDKIYLDYLQNRRGHSVAAPYCVRPKPGAPVSAPLRWDEVKSGLKIEDHTITTMNDRLSGVGDLFSGVLEEGVDMGEAIDALESS